MLFHRNIFSVIKRIKQILFRQLIGLNSFVTVFYVSVHFYICIEFYQGDQEINYCKIKLNKSSHQKDCRTNTK